MKKTLVSALTTALVVGAASTTFAAANPFADVPADHWAYDAVSELQAKGVVNGYAVDNTFRGNQNMTRYEMAQIVAKAMAKVETGDAATKAMVDKLAAEFRDELANLGVRMDDLEARMDNVRHSGFIRYRYARTGGDSQHQNAVEGAGGRRVFDGCIHHPRTLRGMESAGRAVSRNLRRGRRAG